jgi:hypothetical protein
VYFQNLGLILYTFLVVLSFYNNYICWKTRDSESFGKTKLNKTLLKIDKYFYKVYGNTLTSKRYIKLPHGPVPESIDQTLQKLEKSVIHKHHNQYHDKSIINFKANLKPNLSLFSAEEISEIDEIISIINDNYSAKEISNETHDDIYHLAEMGEEIPFYAMLVANKGYITQEDIKWAKEVV